MKNDHQINRHIHSIKLMTTAILLLAITATVNMAHAQNSPFPPSDENGSFGGFDLVSYYTNATPLKGLASHKITYEGIELFFNNEANLQAFKQNPDKYLPAYDGYSATAVAMGSYITPDYSNYKIQDNKLLFFEVRAFLNGKTHWEKNPELNEIIANKNYGKKFAVAGETRSKQSQ